jgi:hypothetical protein
LTDELVEADAGLEVFAAELLDAFGAEMFAPHLPQNFKSSEFSLPHFGQNILHSLSP